MKLPHIHIGFLVSVFTLIFFSGATFGQEQLVDAYLFNDGSASRVTVAETAFLSNSTVKEGTITLRDTIKPFLDRQGKLSMISPPGASFEVVFGFAQGAFSSEIVVQGNSIFSDQSTPLYSGFLQGDSIRMATKSDRVLVLLNDQIIQEVPHILTNGEISFYFEVINASGEHIHAELGSFQYSIPEVSFTENLKIIHEGENTQLCLDLDFANNTPDSIRVLVDMVGTNDELFPNFQPQWIAFATGSFGPVCVTIPSAFPNDSVNGEHEVVFKIDSIDGMSAEIGKQDKLKVMVVDDLQMPEQQLSPGDIIFTAFDNDIGAGDDAITVMNLVPLQPGVHFTLTDALYDAASDLWVSNDAQNSPVVRSQQVTYTGNETLPEGTKICFRLPASGSGDDFLARDFLIDNQASDDFVVINDGLDPDPDLNLSTSDPDVLFLMQGVWRVSTGGARFYGRTMSAIQIGGTWVSSMDPVMTGQSHLPSDAECVGIEVDIATGSVYANFDCTDFNINVVWSEYLEYILDFQNWDSDIGTTSNDLPASACERTCTEPCTPFDAGTSTVIKICQGCLDARPLTDELFGSPDPGGIYKDLNGSGLMDGMGTVQFDQLPLGTWQFEYEGGEANCRTSSILTVKVIEVPNAGQNVTVNLCADNMDSTTFDLRDFLSDDADGDGEFFTDETPAAGYFNLSGGIYFPQPDDVGDQYEVVYIVRPNGLHPECICESYAIITLVPEICMPVCQNDDPLLSVSFNEISGEVVATKTGTISNELLVSDDIYWSNDGGNTWQLGGVVQESDQLKTISGSIQWHPSNHEFVVSNAGLTDGTPADEIEIISSNGSMDQTIYNTRNTIVQCDSDFEFGTALRFRIRNWLPNGRLLEKLFVFAQVPSLEFDPCDFNSAPYYVSSNQSSRTNVLFRRITRYSTTYCPEQIIYNEWVAPILNNCSEIDVSNIGFSETPCGSQMCIECEGTISSMTDQILKIDHYFTPPFSHFHTVALGTCNSVLSYNESEQVAIYRILEFDNCPPVVIEQRFGEGNVFCPTPTLDITCDQDNFRARATKGNHISFPDSDFIQYSINGSSYTPYTSGWVDAPPGNSQISFRRFVDYNGNGCDPAEVIETCTFGPPTLSVSLQCADNNTLIATASGCSSGGTYTFYRNNAVEYSGSSNQISTSGGEAEYYVVFSCGPYYSATSSTVTCGGCAPKFTIGNCRQIGNTIFVDFTAENNSGKPSVRVNGSKSGVSVTYNYVNRTGSASYDVDGSSDYEFEVFDYNGGCRGSATVVCNGSCSDPQIMFANVNCDPSQMVTFDVTVDPLSQAQGTPTVTLNGNSITLTSTGSGIWTGTGQGTMNNTLIGQVGTICSSDPRTTTLDFTCDCSPPMIDLQITNCDAGTGILSYVINTTGPTPITGNPSLQNTSNGKFGTVTQIGTNTWNGTVEAEVGSINTLKASATTCAGTIMTTASSACTCEPPMITEISTTCDPQDFTVTTRFSVTSTDHMVGNPAVKINNNNASVQLVQNGIWEAVGTGSINNLVVVTVNTSCEGISQVQEDYSKSCDCDAALGLSLSIIDCDPINQNITAQVFVTNSENLAGQVSLISNAEMAVMQDMGGFWQATISGDPGSNMLQASAINICNEEVLSNSVSHTCPCTEPTIIVSNVDCDGLNMVSFEIEILNSENVVGIPTVSGLSNVMISSSIADLYQVSGTGQMGSNTVNISVNTDCGGSKMKRIITSCGCEPPDFSFSSITCNPVSQIISYTLEGNPAGAFTGTPMVVNETNQQNGTVSGGSGTWSGGVQGQIGINEITSSVMTNCGEINTTGIVTCPCAEPTIDLQMTSCNPSDHMISYTVALTNVENIQGAIQVTNLANGESQNIPVNGIANHSGSMMGSVGSNELTAQIVSACDGTTKTSSDVISCPCPASPSLSLTLGSCNAITRLIDFSVTVSSAAQSTGTLYIKNINNESLKTIAISSDGTYTGSISGQVGSNQIKAYVIDNCSSNIVETNIQISNCDCTDPTVSISSTQENNNILTVLFATTNIFETSQISFTANGSSITNVSSTGSNQWRATFNLTDGDNMYSISVNNNGCTASVSSTYTHTSCTDPILTFISQSVSSNQLVIRFETQNATIGELSTSPASTSLSLTEARFNYTPGQTLNWSISVVKSCNTSLTDQISGSYNGCPDPPSISMSGEPYRVNDRMRVDYVLSNASTTDLSTDPSALVLNSSYAEFPLLLNPPRILGWSISASKNGCPTSSIGGDFFPCNVQISVGCSPPSAQFSARSNNSSQADEEVSCGDGVVYAGITGYCDSPQFSWIAASQDAQVLSGGNTPVATTNGLGSYVVSVACADGCNVGTTLSFIQASTAKLKSDSDIRITAYQSPTTSLPKKSESYVSAEQPEKQDLQYSFYPNPARNEVTLEITAFEESPFSLSITGIDGSKLLEAEHHLINGHNKFVIDVTDLVPGSYVLQWLSGSQTQTDKLIIVR